MIARRGLRRLFFAAASLLWMLAGGLARRRRLPVDARTVGRLDFPRQTRRLGLSMNEWRRDRLRPRWLRLTQRDD